MDNLELLFLRLRDDSDSAMELFFKQLFPRYVLFASSYIINREVCEDIVQDSFLELWQSRKKFDSLLQARAFLYKVVKNKSLNYIRRQKIEQKHHLHTLYQEHENQKQFIESVVGVEVLDIITAEIKRMPKMRCRVMELYMSGYSTQEICGELNICDSTIKTHKARALKDLRKKVNKNMYSVKIVFSTILG